MECGYDDGNDFEGRFLSRRHHATVAIEWSPRGVAVFDAVSHQERRYDDLRQVSGLGGKTAVIAVSRRSLFLRTTRIPDTNDTATIRQILQMRTADLFPVAPGEVAIDFMPLADVNAEGRLALVVAIPTGDLRRIRQEAKEIGLKIERVIPLALGSALVGRAVSQPEAAVVSRELGGIGIDIVSHGELRHSRAVTEGSAIDAEIGRTFSVAALPGGSTVLSGAGHGFRVEEAATETTSTPLEALATQWPDDWRLNLELPEEVEAKIKAEVGRRMRMSALMAMAAGLFLTLVALDYSDKAAAVKLEQNKAATANRKLTTIQKEKEKALTEQQGYEKTLVRAFQPAQRLGDVIAIVSNLVPPDAWLSGVSVERGKPIIIRGTAKNGAAVTTYVQRLIGEDRLRDVKLVFSTNAMLDETPIVQFSVSAFPVGNLPVNEPKSKTTSRTASR
jgi:Tfp pilus assembly protein PilN